MGLTESEDGPAAKPSKRLDLRVKVAGFGGQGVLMLGEVLAEAGLDAGYEVSWLPSYGPEMRSGTSNCHVRVGSDPVDSPLVTRPNILIAMNEPSLHKFINDVEPGGIVLYNDDAAPDACVRPDVRMFTANFTGIADQLGSAKAANMVMLGALLEAGDLMEEPYIAGAIKRKVKTQRWFDLDMTAIAAGRKQVHADVPA
jgi:2-oxoisovalerate ferredoxin oxidoreductase beta subunit